MRDSPPPPGQVVKYHLPKMACDAKDCTSGAVAAVIDAVSGEVWGFCRAHILRVSLFRHDSQDESRFDHPA